MERVGFVGLGTMGAAMAANLARAGFPLTVWNRTAGRAGDLIALGATEAKTPADLAKRRRRRHLRLRHARRRSGPLRAGRRRGGRPAGHPRHRLLHDLALGHARLRRTARREGHPPGRRAGVGRLRRRPEGHPDDLRRRRRGRRRARPARSRRHGQDDHPPRAARQRAGRQGRQPGDPRRRLPRGRGGHGPRDQGRPGPGAARRGAVGRRGARRGSSRTAAPDDRRTTTRSASRSRCTARTWGSRWSSPARQVRRCRWPRCASSWKRLVAQGHGDEDISAVARTIRALSGLESDAAGRRQAAGAPTTAPRPARPRRAPRAAASARPAGRRSAAGTAPRCSSRRRPRPASAATDRAGPRARTCRRGARPSGRRSRRPAGPSPRSRT